MPLDHGRLARNLLPFVLRAGAIEMGYFASDVTVTYKSDRSPVTAADQAAEALLIEGLAAVAPGVPVVAEERAAAGHIPATGDAFFLVDPLDGTREFIRGGREFTVNVGLVVGGEPVFGLIYAPALAALYVTTGPGEAVMANLTPTEPDARLDAVETLPLRTKTPDPSCLVAVESRARPSRDLATLFTSHTVREHRKAASSLKFCLVAAGEADVYAQFGETSEWDTAAGHAILVAAGGTVTRLDGRALVYGQAARGFANPSFIAWGKRPPEPW